MVAAAKKPVKSRRTPKYSKSEITEIFDRFAAQDPHPTGELHYVNPYTLLVAVALSAQATDVGVNKATRPLFEKVTTPEQMVALGEDELREAIKTIGLYRNKAKNVIALSQALIANHKSRVPEEREALEALPGVGRKTANVEVAAEIHADPRALRKAYLEVVDKYLKQVQKICDNYGVDYALMNTRDHLDATLSRYLAFRKKNHTGRRV